MKKILIFSTAYYPFVAGAEVSVKEITDRLAGDFEFDLITAKFRKDLSRVEKIGAVTVYRVGVGKPLVDKLLLPFLGALLAWKLAEKNNYLCFWGIMATFASGAGYMCNIARYMFRKKKIPMILTFQEGDSEEHFQYKWGGLINLSWRLALWQTDIVTALSNFLLHRAHRMGYTGRGILVPNGVDVAFFSREFSLEDKDIMKIQLGKKIGDIFVVTTSRLNKKNAVDDIISAIALLPAHFFLVVIGKGEEGVALQKQAQRLGVSDRVKFLGFVPYTELPQYLSVCDIFVRPSRSEGFGNSFIEAMASRLPVIATPVGGIPDFLDDKKTGVFCAVNNPQSIRDAVLTLVDNTALKEDIVQAALARVSERYDWNHIANTMKAEVFDTIRTYE